MSVPVLLPCVRIATPCRPALWAEMGYISAAPIRGKFIISGELRDAFSSEMMEHSKQGLVLLLVLDPGQEWNLPPNQHFLWQ